MKINLSKTIFPDLMFERNLAQSTDPFLSVVPLLLFLWPFIKVSLRTYRFMSQFPLLIFHFERKLITSIFPPFHRRRSIFRYSRSLETCELEVIKVPVWCSRFSSHTSWFHLNVRLLCLQKLKDVKRKCCRYKTSNLMLVKQTKSIQHR